jgi:hypothetical protein
MLYNRIVDKRRVCHLVTTYVTKWLFSHYLGDLPPIVHDIPSRVYHGNTRGLKCLIDSDGDFGRYGLRCCGDIARGKGIENIKCPPHQFFQN